MLKKKDATEVDSSMFSAYHEFARAPGISLGAVASQGGGITFSNACHVAASLVAISMEWNGLDIFLGCHAWIPTRTRENRCYLSVCGMAYPSLPKKLSSLTALVLVT